MMAMKQKELCKRETELVGRQVDCISKKAALQGGPMRQIILSRCRVLASILLKQKAPFAPIRISADKLLLDDENYEYMDESED